MIKDLRKNWGTACLNMALVTSSLTAPAAVLSYYQSRRGGYTRSNYLIDGELTPSPYLIKSIGHKNLRVYSKVVRESLTGNFDIQKGQKTIELVLVDANVVDKSVILKQARPGLEVVEVKEDGDVITQLVTILSNYKELNALHILSHAESGKLYIGGEYIDKNKLENRLGVFKAINESVKKGGDLLLYGCDLASNEEGDAFLEIIKGNTNVDVAASIDKTGNSDLNANWDLEIAKGDIETSPLSKQMDLGNFNETMQIAELEIFSQLDTNFVSQPIGSGGSTVYTRDGNFALSNIYKNDAGEPFMRRALNQNILDGTSTSFVSFDMNNYLSKVPAGHTVNSMYYGNGSISLGFEMTGAESVAFYSYSYNASSGSGYGGFTNGVKAGDRVDLSSGSDPSLSYFNNAAYTVGDSYFAFSFLDNNINGVENYVAGMRIYSWLPFKYASTNNSPVFSSTNSATVISNTDAATIVLDVNATNGDGGNDESDITYSISGTDADDFAIDADDGELRFIATPDHGVPTDANLDNIYELIVTANDGENSNNITDESVTITVDALQVSKVDIVVASSISGTLTEQELTDAGITQTGLSTDQVSIISNHVVAANPAPNTSVELQTIVNAALTEESVVNIVVSSSTNGTLTEQELTDAGITQTGLSADQLSVIVSQVVAANPVPNTSAELQTIVDVAIAEESTVNAVVSSSTNGTLTEQELTDAGITQTGLSTDQLSIISSQVVAANPVPNTSVELQTIVDLAIAEEFVVNTVVSSSTGGTLTEQELTDAGITQTGLSADQLSIISSQVVAANPAPNTSAELQTIVDAALVVSNIDLLSKSEAILVYPNPNVGYVTIEYPLNISIINIDLLDMKGLVVQKIALDKASGTTLSLDLGVSKGVYLLRIETSSQVIIERVTIE